MKLTLFSEVNKLYENINNSFLLFFLVLRQKYEKKKKKLNFNIFLVLKFGSIIFRRRYNKNVKNVRI